MTNDEKPFRPSTELDVEWLLDADCNHMISFTPPPAFMSDAIHELIAAQLADLTGIHIIEDNTSCSCRALEDAAESRHQLNAAEWRAKYGDK